MGTRGPVARRDLSLAVEPVGKIPAPPKSLGPDGREAWRTAWRQCSRWLTTGDGPLIERFAELHDERTELRVEIKASGRTTKGSQGQLVDHPLVSQLRAVEALILKHEQVIGIGPLHRARIGVAVAKAAKDATGAEQMLERYRRLAREGQ